MSKDQSKKSVKIDAMGFPVPDQDLFKQVNKTGADKSASSKSPKSNNKTR